MPPPPPVYLIFLIRPEAYPKLVLLPLLVLMVIFLLPPFELFGSVGARSEPSLIYFLSIIAGLLTLLPRLVPLIVLKF
jgi:hypothetical protein